MAASTFAFSTAAMAEAALPIATGVTSAKVMPISDQYQT
jgi:hypothetical protein